MFLYQTEVSHIDTAASGEKPSVAQNHDAADTQKPHIKQRFKPECFALVHEETSVNV